VKLDALMIGHARAFPAEVAGLLSKGDWQEAIGFCRALPDAVAAPVIAASSGRLARDVLADMDEARIAALLGAAEFEDAVGLLTRMPPEWRSAVIAQVASPRRRQMLAQRFAFPEGTLGAIASRSFISVPYDASLRDVADELHALSNDRDDEPPIYILTDGGRLHGALDLYRALETEDLSLAVEACMVKVEPLPAEMPLGAALASPRWNHDTILPVVDRDHCLLGAVTLQRVREATEPGQDAKGFDAVLDLSQRFLEVLAGIAGLALGRKGRP
jgi:Mg/Co/Ni transporter MgtE